MAVTIGLQSLANCDIKSGSPTSCRLPMTLSTLSVLEVRRMPKKTNNTSLGRPAIDLTGQIFGDRTVLKYVGGSKWLCRCQCGSEDIVDRRNFCRGRSTHCANCKPGAWKHGETCSDKTTREYRAWSNAKQRCRSLRYAKWYGDVKFYDAWNDFEIFLRDMGRCPKDYTLDRIDPYGNYEPGNCRWATLDQQACNRRKSRDRHK